MKATRKLIPALALLLVSAVLLSTASYAWFTTNTTVSATTTVSVTAPENLQISTDDGSTKTWKTAVEMFEAEDGNILRPVSSVDGINFFTLNNAKIDTYIDGTDYTMDATGKVQKAGETEVLGTAAELEDLEGYVYSDSVYLLSGNAVGETDSSHVLGAIVTITTTDDAPYNNIKNAVRVMIQIGDETYIFGEADYLEEEAIFEDADGFDTAAVSGTEEYTTGGAAKVLTGATLAAGTAKTVNVYVWYEGNDSSCVSQNVIADNSMNIEIKFVLIAK